MAKLLKNACVLAAALILLCFLAPLQSARAADQTDADRFRSAQSVAVAGGAASIGGFLAMAVGGTFGVICGVGDPPPGSPGPNCTPWAVLFFGGAAATVGGPLLLHQSSLAAAQTLHNAGFSVKRHAFSVGTALTVGSYVVIAAGLFSTSPALILTGIALYGVGVGLGFAQVGANRRAARDQTDWTTPRRRVSAVLVPLVTPNIRGMGLAVRF